MLLTIDAGNTRTKWAIFNRNGERILTGACVNDQLPDIDLSPASLDYERVIISNVAGKTQAACIEHSLSKYHLPITWLKASRQSCNLINNYHEAETLGTDRWAALIAAWHLQQAPCIVVNAGTAVTIDALAIHSEHNLQGEFLGGVILPGISLMLTSLGQHTAQLPKFSTIQTLHTDKVWNNFATSTAEAVEQGILSAITGAITQMTHALKTKSGKIPYIIISGGDASVVHSCLIKATSNPSRIMEHLVLTGLYLADRYNP